MSLLLVDLSLFESGSSERDQGIATQLVDSLKQHGFVKVCGHGLPPETVNTLFALVSLRGLRGG